MNLDLQGKKALVCGSTQGIGLAAATELAGLGATVTLLARNEEKLKHTLLELPALHGQKHQYLVADFQYPEFLKSILKEHIGSGHQYHILINNTGGPPGGPASEAPMEEFRIAFNQHLICNHILAQAVIPGMKEAGYGRIVNVISTSVKIPLNGLGVSNTVRGAVANWSKTLANELGVFGITVNNVLPGATNTTRLSSLISAKSKTTGQSEDALYEGFRSQVPMKRIAEPNEIANAIAFLASPAASYINGINLPVDGGRTGSL
ncbi:MAG: SDR family oxidoreductase [Flavobacteriales bacterium]|nr:SDR family oxidoreductase [Flavobacteriales bacterium]